MKITTFFLITVIFGMYADDSYSQRTRITLNVKDILISEVFDEIEKTTEFKFIYSINNVDLERKVSINVEQLRIHNVLQSLFYNTSTVYKLRGRQVILTKLPPPAPKIEVSDSLQLAQEKWIVRGLVVDNLGVPLPGVSVVEKGTTNGVASDFDGNFEIIVEEGAVLVFSSIGFLSLELAASPDFMNIKMKENISELEEVIVVAQGITKDRKALGFGVAKVNTAETEGRPEADVTRTLQGKIAGVQITPSSGSSGDFTNITVRGNLSLTQGNNALIVVDNVPFSGNLLDIDPNSIANITVLKGLNASVLYGSLGRNGVILIETKSGSAKVGKRSFTARLSQTAYTNNVANLPDFQNTYGVGNNLVTDASTVGNLGSNGARFTDVDFVPHPLAGNPSFPEFPANAVVPFEPVPNNVRDFFNTGIGQITALNIDATGEKTSLNFSLGYTSEGGILGNNDFQRFNIGVGGTAQLTDKLKLSSSISYSARTRNSYVPVDILNDGEQEDILQNLYIVPRSLDIHSLPFEDPLTGASVYYRSNRENPLWTLENTGRERTTRRINGVTNLTYEFNKNHRLKYRGAFQYQTVNQLTFRNRGGVTDDIEDSLGSLNLDAFTETIADNTLIFESNFQLSDHIGLDSQIGVNSRFEVDTSQETDLNDQIVFGVLRPNNFRVPDQGDYDEGKENLLGVFGQFDFNYNQYLYLNLSGRLDKGSTVESENQNLFYPGVSLSFIPTSAFDFKNSFVNFLKIRAAYATSAGFPGRFNTRNRLISDPRNFSDINGNLIVANNFSRTLGNIGLGPELHREFELGLEGNFFDNAITLQVSAFNRISEDQIFETEVARSTGFDDTFINAGRLDTRGLELDLSVSLFRKSEFNWDIRNTFATFTTEVVELANNATRLEGDQDLVVGEDLGAILGSYVMRDPNGNALINPATGVVIASDDVGLQPEVIGSTIPDFTATSIHTFRYKNFSLSTQLEYTHGGDLLSPVVELLLERGITTDTRNREGSFLVPGVLGDVFTGQPLLDANGNTIPNTSQITGNNAVFANFYDPDENITFDASVFRIREIALSYSLTKDVVGKLPFQSIDFSVSGRNVFFHAPNFPSGINLDPETVELTTPTTRRYAFTVSVNF
ncbi:SusC/RagA family TonB-linked outer membrane protein [Muricauda sp. SCSIO 64092]|uniref:SusC/RagA family TonB-linked outer membrane protein n=1 Tax=Allomuricauda sp. SCSIO 64092 TaxID=2908842 RepID=UPI001FF5D618|nr:SusC/RagA family TonB-linked outer membrane protein [Muricauda sp. SCSIO 64092]UOY05281.1 SusC/RagA family TonB-linked outer membrane protein [Muricauda sp. SCSIO 64092]